MKSCFTVTNMAFLILKQSSQKGTALVPFDPSSQFVSIKGAS